MMIVEECRTILEVITCINEDRDCQALTRIKSQNSHSFIQWCCHRNPECRPSALEAIEHSWLCRTTAEDNKYCSDRNFSMTVNDNNSLSVYNTSHCHALVAFLS